MLRKISIIFLEVSLGLAVVLGILGAVSAWRLSQGPVSIKFLLPYVGDILYRTESPVGVDLDDLIVTWAGWDRALDLRALRVKVNSKNTGQRLTYIREVSVTLSAHALIRGKIAPTNLEIIRPFIRLSREKDGNLRFGMGELTSTSEDVNGGLLAELLDQLSEPYHNKDSIEYLKRISVIGAALSVEDRKMDINWGAEHADISLELVPSGIRASFDLATDFRTFKPELIGEAHYDRIKQTIDISTRFKNLITHKLADRFEVFDVLQPLDAIFSGEIRARVGLEGRVERAEFELKSASGSIRIPGIDAPPITFRKITAEGHLGRTPDQLHITNLSAEFADATAELKGLITRMDEIATVDAFIQIPTFPINALEKFWLPGISVNARNWVTKNVRNGLIKGASTSLSAQIDLAGEDIGDVDLKSINGQLTIEGATIDYLSPMPPITNAAASATFNNKRLNFKIHRGHSGELTIEDGTVDISDIGTQSVATDISGLVRGPVKSALDMIAHPRLSLLQSLGLTMDGVEGRQATRLKIAFPLLKDLKAEDVLLSATSDIRDLSVKSAFRGMPIDNGRIALTVNNESLSASGEAVYANTATSFKWTEDFSGRRPIKRRLDTRFIAGTQQAKLFDIHFPEIFDGSAPIQLVYEERRDNTAVLSAGLDLQDVKISLPGLDWVKLPGLPGTAQVSASLRDGAIITVDHFQLDSGIFSMIGEITFATREERKGQEIATLRLKKFKLGLTEFSANIQKEDPEGYSIAVNGRGLDASPFLRRSLKDFHAPNLPRFRLTGKFDKFWIGSDLPANNVELKIRYDGKHWQNINLRGALPRGGKTLEFRMLPDESGHVMALYSADAGLFLKAMNITDTISGGSIEIAGIRKDGSDSPWTGTAEMKRFRIANAPGIARLFSIASFTGLGNLVAGRGIEFKRFRLPFVFENDVAIIKGAQGFGSELGVTGSGKIDFGKYEIDLNGTMVPAYTINSLLGKIPVIGNILSGEKGGGIFAASYKVSGSIENPTMSVNPLSALAPGFLRKLLEGREGLNEGKTPSQEENLEK